VRWSLSALVVTKERPQLLLVLVETDVLLEGGSGGVGEATVATLVPPWRPPWCSGRASSFTLSGDTSAAAECLRSGRLSRAGALGKRHVHLSQRCTLRSRYPPTTLGLLADPPGLCAARTDFLTVETALRTGTLLEKSLGPSDGYSAAASTRRVTCT